MNEKIVNFIDNLSITDTEVLYELLSSDLSEVKKYTLLSHQRKNADKLNGLTVQELAKDIPMTKLPVIGISRLDWCFPTVYHYMSQTETGKLSARGFGPKLLADIDISLQFFIEHMDYLIRLHSGTISNGLELLERDYEFKQKFVLEHKKEIYSLLKETEKSYIFSNCKNEKAVKEFFLTNGAITKREKEILPILIRYSKKEDIEEANIDSFQKFIRK